MRVIRVFPRYTNATPDDSLVRVGVGPTLFDEADEVHISVTFTWDIPYAEWLAKQWECVANVKVGGPAYNDKGGEFIPGMYIKPGYVITSRGCPNKCWFCDAWKKEGNEIREIPINDGHNILDNNILACSLEHQENVFSMLKRQKKKPMFTGGLEAKRFNHHHAEVLKILKPQTFAFAYDEKEDYEPLVNAAKICLEAGLIGPGIGHTCRSYVLIGYPKDTIEQAEKRLESVCRLYIMPEAMLYNKEIHKKEKDGWVSFQRMWMNPFIVGRKMKEILAA